MNINKEKNCIGSKFYLEKTFIDQDVRRYAELTGDYNPLHLDDEYAAKTKFKKRIVQGMNVASLFSTLFANNFPGFGSIYVRQNLDFSKPVYIGDRILATATLTQYYESKSMCFFDTVCQNQANEVVISGTALLIAP